MIEAAVRPPEETEREASGGSRSRRLIWATAVLVMLSVAAGSWALGHAAAPSAADRRIAPAVLTTPVVRGVLSDTITVGAQVAQTNMMAVTLPTVSVPNAVSIITSPSLAPGDVVRAGTQIADIAGQPVFAMPGSVPMYRTFLPGTVGPDVAQLQEALGQMGMAISDAPGFFGQSTQLAVQTFFAARGFVVPLAPSGRRRRGPKPVGRVTVPQWSIVFVNRLPARVIADHEVEGQAPPAGAALELAAGTPRVKLALSRAQAALVGRGMRVVVHVTRPGSSRRETIRGTISSVGPTGAFVTPHKAMSVHGAGSVSSATIVLQRTQSAVLSVPQGAIFQKADGSADVIRVEGITRTEIPVTPGADVAGEVAVRAADGMLKAGDLVLVGE